MPDFRTDHIYRTAAIALMAAVLWIPGRSYAGASTPYLGAFSFEVLNAAGTNVVGHSRYELSRDHDLLVGRGAAHFKDGQYDVEYDTLEPRSSRPPALLMLDHKFYNADGSMQREITADFRTGQATCTHYRNGVAQTDSAKLDFTPNSYGGSTVILPLQQDLAQGDKGPIKLRALNCIPKPRLITVEATVRKPSHWSHYPGQTVEVDIKPDLGWLNVLVAPFLPELRAWFDPSDNWVFAGGEFSRYFRGPRILLVREPSVQFKTAKEPSHDG